MMESSYNEEEQFLIDAAADEELEEEEEPRRHWFLTLFVIILLSLLIAILCPVSDTKKKQSQSAARRNGAGVVGQTRYEVISYKPHFEMSAGKYTIVGVTLNITNLASTARNMDTTIIKVGDVNGNEYFLNTYNTERYYEAIKKKSPWGEDIAGNAKKRVEAFFLIYKGAPQQYYLAGKDMDFRTTDFVKLNIGVIDVNQTR